MRRSCKSVLAVSVSNGGSLSRSWATSLAAAAALLTVLSFASPAHASPQGPWLLPAGDISAPLQDAFAPQLTASPDGTVTAVWQRNNGTHDIIQAATRPPGGSFAAPVDLSAPLQDAFAPQLTASPDGTVTAIWRRSNGANQIIQAATRPPGGSFAAPVDLSAPLQSAFDPQLTASLDGTVTAVWQRSNGANNIIQAATRPPGGSFGAPVDLSAPLQNALQPQLTASPDGSVTAVWTRSNGTNFIIQVATRPPGGFFGAPVDLSASLQSAGEPQLTASADGTLTAVWSRSNGTHNIIQASTRPPSGSFAAPVDLSAPLQSADQPQLTASPDGTVTAVWTRYNGANFITQAATHPPGGAFGAPVDLSAPLQNADLPQLTASPDGTVTAVWKRNNGANQIIQAATRPPGGAFGTPVDLSASLQSAGEPQLTASADGGIIAAWRRSNGTNSIIQSASTAQPSPLLQVAKAGTGTGKVSSAPAGINCGSDCSESYLSFTKVTLTATPSPGSAFTGWSGAGCSGTGTCEVTVLDATTVTANFGKAKISKVKVSGPAKVKKGKKATYKVAITNSGDAEATGVRLKVSGKGVSFNTSVGTIASGNSRTVKVKIKPKKTGKIKATFKVTSPNAGGKSVKKTVSVKR